MGRNPVWCLSWTCGSGSEFRFIHEQGYVTGWTGCKRDFVPVWDVPIAVASVMQTGLFDGEV